VSCRAFYPAEKSPAGYQTCGTKFCGVSNPREQLLNTNISWNSKQNSNIFSGVNLGTIWGRFVEKNLRSIISCYCPCKYGGKLLADPVHVEPDLDLA
jgi:hypothetical protein